jgi:hypothetical protein
MGAYASPYPVVTDQHVFAILGGDSLVDGGLEQIWEVRKAVSPAHCPKVPLAYRVGVHAGQADGHDPVFIYELGDDTAERGHLTVWKARH